MDDRIGVPLELEGFEVLSSAKAAATNPIPAPSVARCAGSTMPESYAPLPHHGRGTVPYPVLLG